MDDDALRRALLNMFGSDSRFRRMLNGRHLYHANIEGAAVGVVLATFNADFNNYALNKKELVERLLKGKASGTIRAAYVANTKLQSRTVVEVADAEKLYTNKLQHMPCRNGPYGEFWTASIFTDEEEPF